jgi:hypothetical protein
MNKSRSAEPVPKDSGDTTVPTRTLLVWMFGFIRPVRNLAVAACVLLALANPQKSNTYKIRFRADNQHKKIEENPNAGENGLLMW